MKQPVCSLNRINLLVLVAFLVFFSVQSVKAQQEEVLLSFRHPAIGNVYVNSLYDTNTNQVFLPVIELFSLLEINYQPETTQFTIRGNFITPDTPYSINLSAMEVQLGKTAYPISPSDFRLGETDYYLSPAVFGEIFKLNFTVEIAALMLSLETTHKLPVQERKAREQNRDRMEGGDYTQDDFPLTYDLKRNLLGGAMLDYSVTGDYSADTRNLGYTFTGGMEGLGGDLQGTISGAASGMGLNSMHANGLRWRYAIRDNNWLSGVMLGQSSTTGLQPVAMRGVSLTNDPIEPRRMYDTYVIDGHTEADSEVELYVNERLTDFKRADELGYYRFDVPVTYGTTRLSLRIYTPSGELIVTDKQMQVPFTFLPKGVLSYNIQAGRVESYYAESMPGNWVAHGNVALGLTNWLTASAGSQFLGDSWQAANLMYYGNLSARLFKQYLLSIDAAPDNFYRFTGSVMYTNNISLNINYTRYDGISLFNARGATDELMANFYVPLQVFGLKTGLRFSGQHIVLPTGSYTDFNADMNARLGKVDLRFNYRDNFQYSPVNEATLYGEGVLSTILTYTIAQTPGIPVFVRGMYLRAQNSHNIRQNKWLESNLELSRTVFKKGRITFSMAYSNLRSALSAQLGLILDLNRVRSTSMISSVGRAVSARQSFNGTVGWDVNNNALQLSNRQQVGRSAASVVLYVDNNNSNSYDAGDQLLPYRGIKLDRTTRVEVGKDSILRITQLQSYYKYNLMVNRNAIPDPTLVPLVDKFSFIADPNQYKRIEIPFYRGGTIEGAVLVHRQEEVTGQGGLRLLLKAQEGDYESIVRTMSDGGFYVMDLAPGTYTMSVDPAQLAILKVKQAEVLRFRIEALAEGDYKEGLTIRLVAVEEDPK